jgi:hypothetical protein
MPIPAGRLTGRRLPHLLAAPLAIVFACSTGLTDEFRLPLVTPDVITQRLKAGQVRQRERQAAIATLFRELGCEVQLQQVDGSSSNVICELPGETAAAVVVGGHYDFVERGQGIVDDWSGAALLPSLYETLKTKRPKHTFRFVAFTEEERGLLGSSRFVKELSAEERAEIKAFINLECLGLTEPKVWVHRSAPILVQRLMQVAASVHIRLEGVNVDRVGDDDTHPFLNKKIPVVTIHSVTQETWSILHSYRDNMNAIHPSDYYDAYRLVAFYLAYLDADLDAGPVPAQSVQ